jgi:FkbM family methyltransferase
MKNKQLLDALMYPVVYLLNRPVFDTFNKLVLLFAYKINGASIAWEGISHIAQNEERFLRKFSGKINGGIVFDVGANVGHYALAVKSVCPQSKIIAFEPQPITFQTLQKKCAHTDVICENKALSESIGTAKLYEIAGQASSSVASLTESTLQTFGSSGEVYEVATETIDRYCEANRIEQIRFLKIDTEGHDIDVLKGAKDMLASGCIDIIEFEFIPANIFTNVHFYQFCEILSDFELFRLCLNGSLTPMLPYDYRFSEFYAIYNVIAVRKGMSN